MSGNDESIGEESMGVLNIDESEQSHDDSSKSNSSSKKESSRSSHQDQEELEKLKSDYLYLRAEFDNYRKQAIKERSDLMKYGAERFVMQILTVLDNFDLALATEVNKENFKDFKKGVEMTAKEFRQVLNDMGVKEVDPRGEAFDPMMHDALSSEESNDVPEGHILRVFKKAYKLHDKIIRPAQVVVAKPVSDGETETSDGE